MQRRILLQRRKGAKFRKNLVDPANGAFAKCLAKPGRQALRLCAFAVKKLNFYTDWAASSNS